MNSSLIAMFVFICGLVVLLMYHISRLMEMQEDLREQHDEIRKNTLVIYELQLDSLRLIEKRLDTIESSLDDLDRKIDILHELLIDDVDAISSYLEIMKNTILDMNDKMNQPAYGGEVNDTEEADLMPEHWTTVSPTLHIHYTEDENM